MHRNTHPQLTDGIPDAAAPLRLHSVVCERTTPAAAGAANFPALAALRLGANDAVLLRRQGFVAPEPRDTKTYFKLRFRGADGRQVVRSLGTDPQRAAVITAELSELQSDRNLRRELTAIDKLVRDRRRQAKRIIEPYVLARNWKFHGRTVRRPRVRSINE